MPAQQDIDRFTLAFHEQAVARLRQDASLIDQALATLDRWRAQRGVSASDPYYHEWRQLLEAGPDAVARRVCQDNDGAAAMRSVSPLGFVLSAAERMALRGVARAPDATRRS